MSNSSFTFNFPQELENNIIAHLWKDKETLTQTSLVSRSWLSFSRECLFDRIELSVSEVPSFDDNASDESSSEDSEEGSSLSKFKELDLLLGQSPVHGLPPLGAIIREVEVCRARSGSKVWKDVEPTMALLLRKLTGVRRLRLREVHLHDLSSEFRASLLGLCKSETVAHLSLWNCHAQKFLDFARLLSCPLNLKGLQMSFTKVDIEETLSFGANTDTRMRLLRTSSPIQLATLGIETGPFGPIVKFLTDARSPVDLSQLQELRLTHLENSPDLPNFIGQLLEAAGQSLRYLELWAPSGKCDKAAIKNRRSIDLNLTPRLGTLKLQGLLFSNDVDPVACTTSFFENVATPHGIERYLILVNVVTVGREELDWSKWKKLDKILSKPEFGSLRELSIVLNLSYRNRRWRKNQVYELQSQFRRLNKRNIVRVEIQC